MKKQFLLLAVFLTALCALSAQKKESLAVFPFTGGNASDGEAIAASLARQPALRNAFNKTTLITRSNIAALNFEQRFQRYGLTDADTIFELGKNLAASHVIAGYITKLGNNNLILVSIMDIESLQQIAGDYRTYGTIEETDKLLGDIAQKLASAVTRNTSGLPGLSVPPFTLLSGADQNDAMVLAQILSCDLANGNRYAVLPRTDSLDKVLEEHRRQRSGETDQTRTKLLGAGRNAQYVLSGSVQRLGTTINKIAVDILDIVDGSMVDPYEERYSDLSDGFAVMPKLAFNLNNPGLTVAYPANMVRIEGGTFIMGSPSNEVSRSSDEVQHRVTVSAFYMSKYQVMQAEYQAVMRTNPSNFKGATLPVENVSWYDAVEYCNALSQREGLAPAYTIDKNRSDPNNTGSSDTKRWLVTRNPNANGYRLPTEAEWEYACRAGTTTPFSTGNNITTNNANYDGNYPYNNNAKGTYRARTTTVGSFRPNPFGLFDMHGNVWEWCWDWYGEYKNEAQTNPTGAVSGAYRVMRGGFWFNYAGDVRSANRGSSYPSSRRSGIGFRLVRN